jgi:hypothetical protein
MADNGTEHGCLAPNLLTFNLRRGEGAKNLPLVLPMTVFKAVILFYV